MDQNSTDTVNTVEPTAPVIPEIAQNAEPARTEAEQTEQGGTEQIEPTGDDQSQQAAESAAGNDENADEREKQRPPRGLHERIGQLSRQKREAQTQLEIANAEVERLRERLTGLGEAADDGSLSWEEEQANSTRRVMNEERLADAEARLNQETAIAQQTRQATFMARCEAAAERLPNLDQSLHQFSQLPCSEVTAEFLSDSDRGPEIVSYLASNPGVAMDLARATPFQQGQALARIEAAVSAAPTARKVSKAAPPPTTIEATTGRSEKDPSEMSQEEYNAWYRKRQSAA